MNKYIILFALFVSNQLSGQEFDGYTLYNIMNQPTAYLIDAEGDIAYEWDCPTDAGYATLLMEDGNLMRAAINPGNAINGAAVSGRVQVIAPDASVVWEFVYSTNDYVSHHDIALMPNGGVLLTSWDVRTEAEMEAVGMANASSKYPTRFIEVHPDGSGGGEIVWQWDLYDHMINDVDVSTENYGVIADNPQLLDVNSPEGSGGGPGGGGGDLIHCNGIFYDADKDLICFSSRFLSEVMIIDHSTTTEEAAGHTGGNYGKGGDFLYRWGNPANYGGTNPRGIDGPCHDARFLETDRPNAGFIQFVNNDGVDGSGSQVTAINPPMDDDGNFIFTPGAGFGPVMADWEHDCLAYSMGQSASDRMPNGNIFVALSDAYMYEVSETGDIIWQYAQSPQKAFRYICDHPGIAVLLGENPCGIIDDVEELEKIELNFWPNPTEDGIINVNGLTPNDRIETVIAFDVTGKKVEVEFNNNLIDLSRQVPGVYTVHLLLKNRQVHTEKVSITK